MNKNFINNKNTLWEEVRVRAVSGVKAFQAQRTAGGRQESMIHTNCKQFGSRIWSWGGNRVRIPKGLAWLPVFSA